MNDNADALDLFITDALARAGLTLRSAAARMGVTHGFIAQVKRGHTAFPPEQFQRWCEGLCLNAVQREEFMRLALLPRCPPEIQSLVSALERRIDELHRSAADQHASRAPRHRDEHGGRKRPPTSAAD